MRIYNILALSFLLVAVQASKFVTKFEYKNQTEFDQETDEKLKISDLRAASVNTAICALLGELQKQDSSYLKSVCMIGRKRTHDDGEILCKSAGMELFKADSEQDKLSLANFLGKGVGNFHINGKTGLSCLTVASVNRMWLYPLDSCSSPYFSICEFIDSKTTTTTSSTTTTKSSSTTTIPTTSTTTTTTTSPLSTTTTAALTTVLATMPPSAVCGEITDVFTSTGTYVKTGCYVPGDKTYDEAKVICESNGMRLYQFDSLDAKTGLFAYANAKWAGSTGTTLHVDGQSGTQCGVISKSSEGFIDGLGGCGPMETICEFKNSNPSGIPIKPVDPPATCAKTADLFSSGGIYTKSACYVTSAKTYIEASKFCTANGMTLYRAETIESQQSIIKFATDYNCNGIPFDFFVFGPDSPLCNTVRYNGKDTGISTKPCTDVLSFYCEFINPSPTNPITTCANTTYETYTDVAFLTFGSYKGVTDCGRPYEKTYYVPRFLTAHWFEAKTICEAYGLEFLTFETKDEMNNLNVMASAKQALFDTHNFIGGTTVISGTKTEWYWANTGQLINVPLIWGAGQPNGGEYCMSWSKSGTTFACHDVPCFGSTQYSFLCQRPKHNPDYVAPAAVVSCEEAKNKNQIKTDVVFSKLGSYSGKTKCGRSYMKEYYVPRNIKTQWSLAQAQCESYGMEFVSLETLDESNNFLDLCNKNAALLGKGHAHIGAMTLIPKTTTGWYWVNSGRKVDYTLLFSANNPDFSGSSEFCAQCQFSANVYRFNDIHCYDNAETIFVCQKNSITSEPIGSVKPLPQINPPAICDKIADIKNAPGDYLKTLCFCSSPTLSYDDAEAKCQKNNMQLLRANSPDVRNFLLNWANSNYGSKTWWSFYIFGYSGKECNTIHNYGIGNILFKTNHFEFTSIGCGTKLSFFCEFQRITPGATTTTTTMAPTTSTAASTTVGPAVFACEKSEIPLYFEDFSLMKIGTYKGLSDCGREYHKSYYIPWYTRFTWANGRTICKMFGMEFASVENEKEMAAVQSLLDKIAPTTLDHILVGATTVRQKVKHRWYWVNSERRITYNLPWAVNQPDNLGNNEACMSFMKTSTGYQGNDYSCNGPTLYKVMCQKSIAVDDPIPDIMVNVGTIGKKTIYQSKHVLSFYAAKTECQRFGMRLATLETIEEHDFMLDNADVVGFFGVFRDDGSTAWVSGAPWKVINYGISWQSGEPNNASGNEDCLEKTSVSKLFMDTACSQTRRFVCEKNN